MILVVVTVIGRIFWSMTATMEKEEIIRIKDNQWSDNQLLSLSRNR